MKSNVAIQVLEAIDNAARPVRSLVLILCECCGQYDMYYHTAE